MKQLITFILAFLSLTTYSQTTFFGAASPATSASVPEGGYTVSYLFTPQENGTISAAKWWKPASSAGTRTAGIYATDSTTPGTYAAGVLLASKVYTGETSSGWQTVTFDAAISVVAGRTYVLSTFMSPGTYIPDNDFPVDINHAAYFNSTGKLKIPQYGAGFDFSGVLAYPSYIGDVADVLWMDVVFNSSAPPVGNQPPLVLGGSDKSIVLPTSTSSVNAIVSDDVGVVSQLWTKLSGPLGGSITSPTSLSTAVTALQEGTYVFRLTATDGGGLTAFDDVTVTVSSSTNNNLTFTKIPFSDPDLLRPGGGLEYWIYQSSIRIPSAGSPAENETGRYDRFEWRSFENGAQGVYNWTEFNNSINTAITKGQKFSFGIMSMCDGCTDFTTTVGGATLTSYPLYVHNLMQSEANKDWTYGGTWVPNWNSTSFQNRYAAMLTALAAHINSTSYSGVAYKDVIRYIDIRGYGNYNEWHNYPWNGSMPSYARATVASLKNYVDMHVSAFPNFQLVALSDGYDTQGESNTPAEVVHYLLTKTNNKGLFGYRRDNIGSGWNGPGDYWVGTKLENNPATYGGIQLKNLIVDRWKNAPAVGEVMACCSQNGGGSLYWDLVRQTSFYHISTLGNGNLESPGATATIDAMRLASKTMGYRFTLNGGSMPASLTKGLPFSLKLDWVNEGVAPTYDSWDVVFELRNTSTSAVVWRDTSSFNMRLFLPGSTSITDVFTVPTSVTAGTYHLYMVVKDAGGYMPNMPLFVTGAETGNNYRLRTSIVLAETGANAAPVVNAGTDKTIQLPTNGTTLSGSATDDGTIASYAWTRVSGPTGNTGPTPDNTAVASVGSLLAGTYVFRLTATDNLGVPSFDDITVTVLPAANISPSASAGSDQTKTLPINYATFTGVGTDQDGSIVSYAWTKVSGPSGGTIQSTSSASTSISALLQGVYVYRLTVTDDRGATTADDITITVLPATNLAPSANAGADQIIQLPVASVTLSATASDPDGSVASFQWSKVSGTGGSIANAVTATATASGLTTGAYVFRVTVTDNAGATKTDDVAITVLAEAVNPPTTPEQPGSGKATKTTIEVKFYNPATGAYINKTITAPIYIRDPAGYPKLNREYWFRINDSTTNNRLKTIQTIIKDR